MSKRLSTYAAWVWGNLKRESISTIVDQAYFDWLDTRHTETDTMPIMPSVQAVSSTRKQIDALFIDMIKNNYPVTYVLNHPLARTALGRQYANTLIYKEGLNEKIDTTTDSHRFAGIFAAS